MADDAERLMTGQAWREWCDRLKAVGDEILGDGYPTSPRDRAEGYRALTRLLVYATQMEMEAGNPRHPNVLKYETPICQWGGPNPDNVYQRASVDPACAYRVWADARGMRQAIFSLHEGDMQLGEYGVYSEQTLDDLEVDDDGSLEIWISAERPADAANWMPMHDEARIFMVRIYQSDWENDTAPTFHIERVGAEGEPPPALDPGFVARALDRSANWVVESARYWNRYTAGAWERGEPNVAGEPGSTPGGAENIKYGSCLWELAGDEALVLTCEAPEAQYWNFTIHTLSWLESGDYADRQTSLTGHQVHVDDDGRVRIVVSHRDPGAPNWIDTEGRERGMLVYRWVFTETNPVPRAEVVALADVRARLPEAHPTVDLAGRRASLARRREAAWNRFL